MEPLAQPEIIRDGFREKVAGLFGGPTRGHLHASYSHRGYHLYSEPVLPKLLALERSRQGLTLWWTESPGKAWQKKGMLLSLPTGNVVVSASYELFFPSCDAYHSLPCTPDGQVLRHSKLLRLGNGPGQSLRVPKALMTDITGIQHQLEGQPWSPLLPTPTPDSWRWSFHSRKKCKWQTHCVASAFSMQEHSRPLLLLSFLIIPMLAPEKSPEGEATHRACLGFSHLHLPAINSIPGPQTEHLLWPPRPFKHGCQVIRGIPCPVKEKEMTFTQATS